MRWRGRFFSPLKDGEKEFFPVPAQQMNAELAELRHYQSLEKEYLILPVHSYTKGIIQFCMINKRNVAFLLNIWTYAFFFLDDILLKTSSP